jgi:hypothetical protein
MAQQNVYISAGIPPTCTPVVVSLSVGAGDFVVWQPAAGQNFTNFNVMMDHGTLGSPFLGAKFDQKNSNSGVPLVTPANGKSVYFKYLVEVGGYVADPGVIINP